MTEKAPAFQFYAKDWLDARVKGMTFSAQGAYICMLAHCWADSGDQCSIPDDSTKVRRIVGYIDDDWADVWAEVRPLFLVEDDRLVSKRLRKEWEKQEKNRSDKSEAGKRGAEKRWQKDGRPNGDAIAPVIGLPMAEGMANDSSSSSSSSSSSDKREEKSKTPPSGPPTRGVRIPDDFMVTDEMRDWARSKGLASVIESETEKFVDHWNAKPGKDGVKLDWAATWRNWLRNSVNWSGKGRHVTTSRQQSPNERFIEGLQGGPVIEGEVVR